MVYDYFRYVKAGDTDRLDDLFTENRKITLSDNFIYESIKIYSLNRVDDAKTIADYVKYGRGSKRNLYEIRCYLADFEYKYKDLVISVKPSDKPVVKRYKYDFFIVKENKDSQWKIDDFGFGNDKN